MITILYILIGLLILFFCGIVLFGAPYLPTLKKQINVSLELADLEKGQTLLELGCGDGRVLIAAAHLGLNAIGYELNPFLAFVAWARTRRYRRQVKIVIGNYWTKKWPQTDAIFVFLIDKYMKKLDNKCMQYPYKPLKLVSFAFQIPDKTPVQQKDGIYLYKYT